MPVVVMSSVKDRPAFDGFQVIGATEDIVAGQIDGQLRQMAAHSKVETGEKEEDQHAYPHSGSTIDRAGLNRSGCSAISCWGSHCHAIVFSDGHSLYLLLAVWIDR